MPDHDGDSGHVEGASQLLRVRGVDGADRLCALAQGTIVRAAVDGRDD